MEKLLRSVLLVIFITGSSGCALFGVISPNASSLERRGTLYTSVKQCTSDVIDVDIRLHDTVNDAERDLWTSDALILITVKRLERAASRDIATPLTIAWFHTAERDARTGKVIPRTFTDFPNVLKDRSLETTPQSAPQGDMRAAIKEQYKVFLFSLVPDRTLGMVTLYKIMTEIMDPYTSLIESCVYGF